MERFPADGGYAMNGHGGMAKHVIGIRNDGREFRNKLNALPHQIIAGSVICIRVKTIHLEHAARQDVHNVVSFEFNDIHLGLLLQRHVVVDEFTERREFFLVGQATGKAISRQFPQNRNASL